MKKIATMLLLAGLFMFSSQASNAAPVVGVVYQNTTTPGPYFSSTVPTKSGTATCKSFFWIVGVGACGINDAAKNGHISQITNYDVKKINVLGYQEISTIVYGR